ncbi:MAG: Amuc_1100 family pilus-like protein [Verrucomicrobiales bacterium]
MKSKIWLIVFGVVAVLLLGGTGFYALSSYGDYSESLSSWDAKVGTIENLERQVPYPNEENTEALEAKVEGYEAAVQELFESLDTFQSPLNETLRNTEFQQLVKTRVEDFRRYAKSNGLQFDPELDFQLGFDSYALTLPPPALVPVLDYELEAINHLLTELTDAGTEMLLSFERDPIPGEAGAPDGHEEAVVHKYPVRLRFEGSHESFQEFINSIANDEEFFYVVRVLKVKNALQEGPVKLSAADADSDIPRFEDPLTKQMASYEMLLEWGYDGTEESLSAVEKEAEEAGFVLAKQDARVLMGQENLNVFMVVDIVRFLNPEEVRATAEVEQRSGRRR